MTHTELQTYRRQLLARQNRANLLPVPIHLAGLRADSFDQEFLEEIAAALKRMDQGTFGFCEECRKTIPRARLQVLPYTRYCVECVWKLSSRPPETHQRNVVVLAAASGELLDDPDYPLTERPR